MGDPEGKEEINTFKYVQVQFNDGLVRKPGKGHLFRRDRAT